MAALAAITAPFIAAPRRSVLLFDFDGTLAPIVADPTRARPVEGVVGRLRAVADRYLVVGVVSGRPVEFLADRLPPDLDLSGSYGLESRVDGTMSDHPDADRWRSVIAEAARRMEASGPDGMRLEDKGLSITVHYREHPDLGPAVTEAADEVAVATGLQARLAKMSVELHPPIDADKGTALRAMVAGAGRAVEPGEVVSAVLYAGDDLGDLPAFDALDEAAGDGRSVARIAVGGDELPEELAARADWVAAGPAALMALFDALLA